MLNHRDSGVSNMEGQKKFCSTSLLDDLLLSAAPRRQTVEELDQFRIPSYVEGHDPLWTEFLRANEAKENKLGYMFLRLDKDEAERAPATYEFGETIKGAVYIELFQPSAENDVYLRLQGVAKSQREAAPEPEPRAEEEFTGYQQSDSKEKDRKSPPNGRTSSQSAPSRKKSRRATAKKNKLEGDLGRKSSEHGLYSRKLSAGLAVANPMVNRLRSGSEYMTSKHYQKGDLGGIDEQKSENSENDIESGSRPQLPQHDDSQRKHHLESQSHASEIEMPSFKPSSAITIGNELQPDLPHSTSMLHQVNKTNLDPTEEVPIETVVPPVITQQPSLNNFELSKMAQSEVIVTAQQHSSIKKLNNSGEEPDSGYEGAGAKVLKQKSEAKDLGASSQEGLGPRFSSQVFQSSNSKQASKNVTPDRVKKMQNYFEGGDIEDLVDASSDEDEEVSDDEESEDEDETVERQKLVFFSKVKKLFTFRSTVERAQDHTGATIYRMKKGQMNKGQYVFPFTITLPDRDYETAKPVYSLSEQPKDAPVRLPPTFDLVRWRKRGEAGSVQEYLQIKWTISFSLNPEFASSRWDSDILDLHKEIVVKQPLSYHDAHPLKSLQAPDCAEKVSLTKKNQKKVNKYRAVFQKIKDEIDSEPFFAQCRDRNPRSSSMVGRDFELMFGEAHRIIEQRNHSLENQIAPDQASSSSPEEGEQQGGGDRPDLKINLSQIIEENASDANSKGASFRMGASLQSSMLNSDLKLKMPLDEKPEEMFQTIDPESLPQSRQPTVRQEFQVPNVMPLRSKIEGEMQGEFILKEGAPVDISRSEVQIAKNSGMSTPIRKKPQPLGNESPISCHRDDILTSEQRMASQASLEIRGAAEEILLPSTSQKILETGSTFQGGMPLLSRKAPAGSQQTLDTDMDKMEPLQVTQHNELGSMHASISGMLETRPQQDPQIIWYKLKHSSEQSKVKQLCACLSWCQRRQSAKGLIDNFILFRQSVRNHGSIRFFLCSSSLDSTPILVKQFRSMKIRLFQSLKVRFFGKARITKKEGKEEEMKPLKGSDFEFEHLAYEETLDLADLAEQQSNLPNIDERGILTSLNLGDYQDLLKNKGQALMESVREAGSSHKFDDLSQADHFVSELASFDNDFFAIDYRAEVIFEKKHNAFEKWSSMLSSMRSHQTAEPSSQSLEFGFPIIIKPDLDSSNILDAPKFGEVFRRRKPDPDLITFLKEGFPGPIKVSPDLRESARSEDELVIPEKFKPKSLPCAHVVF